MTRYFLVFFICVLTAVLVYWQDIFPLQRELALNKQQEKQLAQQLKALYVQGVSLEEKMGQLPETQNLLNEWQKKCIKQSDLDKLLKEIAATGKRDKLQIKLLSSQAIIQENHYLKQPVKILLTGDYLQTAQFIEHLASLPWTVVVGDFSLARESSSETGQFFSTDILFYVYYFKANSG